MIVTSWIFSRSIALIYLIAFWSLAVQIIGLVGSHGILPAGDFLSYVSQVAPAKCFFLEPTLCWINHSDSFLLFLCGGGMVLSLMFLVGIWPAITAFLMWLFYLSLTIVGQDFLGFQWDNLLLEAGLLLIFLVPSTIGFYFKPTLKPSVLILWLFRLLLFKLMFESGMVKLLSHDANWRNLTALTYHYWTQPLPNRISWYAAQLPEWFQKLSCFFLFVIELFSPFLIFFGRWCRLIAFFAIVLLQLLIILTGNYCFFNLLAMGLCLTLLEDEHLSVFASVAKQSFKEIAPSPTASRNDTIEGGQFYKWLTIIFASFVLIVNLMLFTNFLSHSLLPKFCEDFIDDISSLRSINNYGLFAVMTTQRDEIILEGSNDQETWLPYEFKYKPGDLNQAPQWAMPYQPRLDWQMWFAALGSWQENQWVLAFMERILKGEPSVLKLLAHNPFANHPPQYLRATLWEYHFTTFASKGAHGPWWYRDPVGLYCPIVSLRNE